VPEYTPNEYEMTYSRIAMGNEFEEFALFFEHYERFNIRMK